MTTEESLNVVYVDETGELLEAAELDVIEELDIVEELDAVEERLEDRDVV
jgi:hypothetical protein